MHYCSYQPFYFLEFGNVLHSENDSRIVIQEYLKYSMKKKEQIWFEHYMSSNPIRNNAVLFIINFHSEK